MIDPAPKTRPRGTHQKLGALAGLVVAVASYLVAFPLETALRLVLGYDSGVATFLAIQVYHITQVSAQEVRDYYESREPSNRIVIIGAVVFSGLSIVCVGMMANVSQNWGAVEAGLHTAGSLLAIVLSWVLLHTLYAFFYAHLYYDVDEAAADSTVRKGLRFPNDEPPDYMDFLYYSFTIAMCYQTSDVEISSRGMRHVTLVHAIVSFLFVSAILSLVINILSNQI